MSGPNTDIEPKDEHDEEYYKERARQGLGNYYGR